MENPWRERILEELVTEQSPRPFDSGLTELQFRERLGVASGSEDALGISEALQTLSRQGLLALNHRTRWSLTDAGWYEASGAVPASEKEEPFLETIVRLFRSEDYKKFQGKWVTGNAAYEARGWSIDPAEMNSLGYRLRDAGLVEFNDRAPRQPLFQPTYAALQRFPKE